MNDSREPEERLAAARRNAPALELSDSWKAGVMQSVREQPVPVVSPSYFEHSVRRAAMAAAVLALLAIGFCVSAGIGATNELYMLVSSAPESLLELALVF